MASDGWGPLPELDRALATLAEPRGPRERGPLAELLDPWRTAITHHSPPLWPLAMATPTDGAVLARLAGEAQAWLATGNLRLVARRLILAPDLAPDWLGGVSGWGLRAALVVHRVARTGTAVGAADALWHGDLEPTPADLLALHGCIEYLAALRSPARAAPTVGRRLGGLRTAAFLSAWLDASQAFRSGLAALAAGSPLTCLVYLDLMTAPPRGDPPPALAGIRAHHHDGDWRCQPWRGLLVDSVVGGLLNRPPALAAWQRAVAELQHAMDEQQRLAATLAAARDQFYLWLGWTWWRIRALEQDLAAASHTLAVVQQTEATTRQAAVAALRGRIANWHRVATELGPELRACILDRLARFAAVAAAAPMYEDWQSLRRQDPINTFADKALFTPDSTYRQTLTALLHGCDAETLGTLNVWDGDTAGHLDGVLALPPPTGPTGMAARFWDKGIRLPFQTSTPSGPTPATLFEKLLTQLPRPPMPAPTPAEDPTDADTTETAV